MATPSKYVLNISPQTFVRYQLTKRGTEITLGCDAETSHQLLSGTHIPVLYIIDKEKFFKLKS